MKYYSPFAILIFILAFLSACSSYTTITGRVAVAGHEPFSYVRLIDQGQTEYRLVGAKSEILRQQYQQSLITLQGRVVKEAVGPGYPAEFEVVKIVQAGRD